MTVFKGQEKILMGLGEQILNSSSKQQIFHSSKIPPRNGRHFVMTSNGKTQFLASVKCKNIKVQPLENSINNSKEILRATPSTKSNNIFFLQDKK